MSMALYILFMSIFLSLTLFKATMTSWLCFVLILVFSSGMMTLFIYAASLCPNDNNILSKKKFLVVMSLMLMVSAPETPHKTLTLPMKMFSNMLIMVVMALMMIMTMIATVFQAYHPYQTMSTSF